MTRKPKSKTPAKSERDSGAYRHPEAGGPLRPDVGTQAQFRQKKPPKTHRYDSSLSPALDWDGGNGARDLGGWLLGAVEDAANLAAPHEFDAPRRFKDADGAVICEVRGLADAVAALRRLERPVLDWTGRAERLSFDVPTLPLFVHERLGTQAIVETLTGHRRDEPASAAIRDLLGAPERPAVDQITKPYEHGEWTNRLVLGDSLLVMNSLLQYENLGGQVKMIYMDPPYGVNYRSNFQPFVRKREVGDGDEDLTREPEAVKAYRDTWELGIHSYLTYLRDRLLLARDLLHPTGSLFVQISDGNLHHVREILDDVFGSENFIVTIPFKKKGSQKGKLLDPVNDYLLWYARDRERIGESYQQLYEQMVMDADLVKTFRHVDLPDGREIAILELEGECTVPKGTFSRDPNFMLEKFPGARFFTSENITAGGVRKNQSLTFTYKGREFDPGISRGACWKHTVQTTDGSPSGMERLAMAGRLFVGRGQLRYKRYADDFGYKALSNWWDGLGGAANPFYVVQTSEEVVRRCIMMTTRPGDLVLDPTCGSGTTPVVAERWGRRWIAIDTSRVPLALTRQRLLTKTYDWFDLSNAERGPIGGFVYKRKKNKRGQEVGGIVPHITSGTTANDAEPEETVIVDRPEKKSGIVRVTGPFTFEAVIPTPVKWDDDAAEAEKGDDAAADQNTLPERMLEALRKAPVLPMPGGREVKLENIRLPVKTLTLSAEAMLSATEADPSLDSAVEEADEKNRNALSLSDKSVAIVFGPEHGAISDTLVWEAAREAHAKKYAHLFVIGFAIDPVARDTIAKCEEAAGIPATYLQATPDLAMGDLLKTMRSSQIFSICGLPDVEIAKVKGESSDASRWQVTLKGLDTFDPATMETHSTPGDDVPVWFLDMDYNGLAFHVGQAFFPRTHAWENLRKELKATHDDSVWDHLAGNVSAPFEAGEHGRIAVKVIDERGNELMVVKEIGKREA